MIMGYDGMTATTCLMRRYPLYEPFSFEFVLVIGAVAWVRGDSVGVTSCVWVLEE